MSLIKTPHPDALPNFEKATIFSDKLVKYALNPLHPVGSNKARVFKSALGFDLTNWQLLSDSIIKELPYYPAVLKAEDEYGKRYNVLLPITGVNGNIANVLTAWIIKPDNDQPNLTTAWVKE